MRIMLNFLPLKSGGGAQVGLDFLRNIPEHGKGHAWHLVCRDGTAFSKHQFAGVERVTAVKDTRVSRLVFELISCRPLIEEFCPDVIYTQFGPQWPVKSVIQVVGCAYSNLFYPEIDFWQDLGIMPKLWKIAVDRYRLRKFLSADIRIMETMDLRDRAIRQFGLPENTVRFVRPAASQLFGDVSVRHEPTRALCSKVPPGFRVVLLSGYHPNKNIELLVETAEVLKAQNLSDDTVFVTTLPNDHPGTRKIFKAAQVKGVEAKICNIGQVDAAGCMEIYKIADAAVLPSNLESFSNMIAESWTTKTPLLISDLSWARSLCGDGAVYFSHKDPYSLADAIRDLRETAELRRRVVAEGERELQKYGNSSKRFLEYLEIINTAGILLRGEND